MPMVEVTLGLIRKNRFLSDLVVLCSVVADVGACVAYVGASLKCSFCFSVFLASVEAEGMLSVYAWNSVLSQFQLHQVK